MFASRLLALSVPLFLGIVCCVSAVHCRLMFGGTEIESDSHVSPTNVGMPETGWRRTVAGWEHVGNWRTSSDGQKHTQATHLHPGLVAALILLVSLAALLAFDPVVKSYRNMSGVEPHRLLLKRWAHRLRKRAESQPSPPDSL